MSRPILIIGGKTDEELNRIYDFTHSVFCLDSPGYEIVDDFEASDKDAALFAYAVAIRCEDDRKAFELSLMFRTIPMNALIHYKTMR